MAKVHVHEKNGPKFYSEVFAQNKANKKEEVKKEKREARKIIEEKKARRLEKREWYKNNPDAQDESGRRKNTKRGSGKDTAFEKCGSLFDVNSIPKDAKSVLEDFAAVVQGVFPLNSKQIQNLPQDINELSHQLTDQRDERRTAYMNDKVVLSAYTRYFMWWNLVRQTRLFANMDVDSIGLCDDDICLDIGSGPLTVVTALWLACPSLRNKKLTWYCLDLSPLTMSLGEEIYLSVASRTVNGDQQPWKIIRVKGAFGTKIKQKAKFVTCANMFNEAFQSDMRPLDFLAKNYSQELMEYGTKDAAYLLVEPGVPRSARFVSLTRDCFIRNGLTVSSPCPHEAACCMDGRLLKGSRDEHFNGRKTGEGKNGKWCNFAFSTEDAPAKLLKLSQSAHLPKERAVLSFVFAVSGKQSQSEQKLKLRIASDPIHLANGKIGFYACTQYGLALVMRQGKEMINSGDLLECNFVPAEDTPRDKKTGAIIIE
ncbi:MAG: small ribosomal subunit Rsm22 family protein [Treponema sp.]|nr:small ribosomal subunit Rsm22 family protein [Treponema sp.]